MTEQEWLACADPRQMVRFLIGTNAALVMDVEAFPHCKGSDRKLRLFACACYFRIRQLLPNILAKKAVEVAERFADGLATSMELQGISSSVEERFMGIWEVFRGEAAITLLPSYMALGLARHISTPEAPKAAYYVSDSITNPHVQPYAVASNSNFLKLQLEEKQPQAALLHCIFGPLPFRPITIDPLWRTWNDGLIVQMAQNMYEERDFNDLPILSDALIDAGCSNQDIIDHCRSKEPHVRGCWVVDLLLGKE